MPEVVPPIPPEERAALSQTILAGLLSGLGWSIIYWIALIIRGAPGILIVPFGFLYLAIGGIIGAILGLFNATEYRDGIFAGAIVGFAFGLALDLVTLFFLFAGIPGSGWGWLTGPFIGSFIVGLGTNGGIASQLLSAERFGFGPQHLDRIPSLVQAVTLEQANRAMRKYVHPERLLTVIAGNYREE
ncbi:MAG: hypothetical protein ABIK18_05370 [candidate division WOR-3 bacterium]